MDAIAEALKIDVVAVLFGLFVIFSAILAIAKIIEELSILIGKPVKWIRRRNDDHQLIIDTAKNLQALQEDHDENVKCSIHKPELQSLVDNITELIRINQEQYDIKLERLGDTLRAERLEERNHDRGQSFEREKRLQESNRLTQQSISNLSEKIDKMQEITNKRFAANEEKQNKRVRNELKDQISRIYIKCHASKQISDMEIETLEGLIESYEDHKGENSFVHSIVQKEMYTWKRVNE